MKKYEFIEHTADIAIKAYGDTLEEAFASAAEAMFDIITDRSKITAEKEISFEIESIDIEGTLVNFLSELIARHETDNQVMTAFTVRFTGPNALEVTAGAEPFDFSRHGRGAHIKGVSYHMMEIFDGCGKEPCFVQVLFDI